VTLVVGGATIACTFGVAPATLIPTPGTVTATEMPAATIMDFAPMENIPTFAMCMSPANPEVAAATSAAQGVLTPMPCVPVTVAPWSPGSATVTIGEIPALTDDSTCTCAWGGMISIGSAGQESVSIS